MSHSRSEYTTTHTAANKKEHKLPKKLLVELARKDDVVLQPRTQLHVSPEEFILAANHDLADYDHDAATCWRCASEEDADYGVDEDGFCYPVGPIPLFIPR